MRRPAQALAIALLGLAAGRAAGDAPYEEYVDFYATQLTEDTVTLRAGTPGNATTETFAADASTEIGLRGIAVIAGTPWLFGGDLGRFTTGRNCCSDLDVPWFAVFGGWMPRQPWPGHGGRGLRPYLYAGGIIPLVDGTVYITTGDSLEVGGFDATLDQVGPYVAAGLHWDLAPGIAVITEYRQRRINFAAGDDADGGSQADGELDADGFSLGLRWRLPPGP